VHKNPVIREMCFKRCTTSFWKSIVREIFEPAENHTKQSGILTVKTFYLSKKKKKLILYLIG